MGDKSFKKKKSLPPKLDDHHDVDQTTTPSLQLHLDTVKSGSKEGRSGSKSSRTSRKEKKKTKKGISKKQSAALVQVTLPAAGGGGGDTKEWAPTTPTGKNPPKGFIAKDPTGMTLQLSRLKGEEDTGRSRNRSASFAGMVLPSMQLSPKGKGGDHNSINHNNNAGAPPVITPGASNANIPPSPPSLPPNLSAPRSGIASPGPQGANKEQKIQQALQMWGGNSFSPPTKKDGKKKKKGSFLIFRPPRGSTSHLKAGISTEGPDDDMPPPPITTTAPTPPPLPPLSSTVPATLPSASNSISTAIKQKGKNLRSSQAVSSSPSGLGEEAQEKKDKQKDEQSTKKSKKKDGHRSKSSSNKQPSLGKALKEKKIEEALQAWGGSAQLHPGQAKRKKGTGLSDSSQHLRKTADGEEAKSQKHSKKSSKGHKVAFADGESKGKKKAKKYSASVASLPDTSTPTPMERRNSTRIVELVDFIELLSEHKERERMKVSSPRGASKPKNWLEKYLSQKTKQNPFQFSQLYSQGACAPFHFNVVDPCQDKEQGEAGMKVPRLARVSAVKNEEFKLSSCDRNFQDFKKWKLRMNGTLIQRLVSDARVKKDFRSQRLEILATPFSEIEFTSSPRKKNSVGPISPRGEHTEVQHAPPPPAPPPGPSPSDAAAAAKALSPGQPAQKVSDTWVDYKMLELASAPLESQLLPLLCVRKFNPGGVSSLPSNNPISPRSLRTPRSSSSSAHRSATSDESSVNVTTFFPSSSAPSEEECKYGLPHHHHHGTSYRPPKSPRFHA